VCAERKNTNNQSRFVGNVFHDNRFIVVKLQAKIIFFHVSNLCLDIA
jgi:hypothetical protein